MSNSRTHKRTDINNKGGQDMYKLFMKVGVWILCALYASLFVILFTS